MLPIFLALSVSLVLADIDYALECNKGYRVSAVRRTKTHYSILGSLSIECEQVAQPHDVTCSNQQSIPKCTGQLEGCSGDSWLGGYHTFLLENTTQAVVLDPVCCQAPSVHIDSTACIHDQLNLAKQDFSHSIVSDLLPYNECSGQVYRGLQCWHQYDSNRTLVDLLWKAEICPFQSDDFPVVTTETACEECACSCGIQQCASGAEPVRIIHKKRLGRCGCDCTCSFKCIDFNRHVKPRSQPLKRTSAVSKIDHDNDTDDESTSSPAKRPKTPSTDSQSSSNSPIAPEVSSI